ncbi:riboflavin transporter MCH5 [Apiospora rasikravindrae]|uniref:Riboflavin transporter MCH5 n=1 Tax=Apiospora rasikravindrae TaxID=990691 RepID=A0ABR1RS78_9PEZI
MDALRNEKLTANDEAGSSESSSPVGIVEHQDSALKCWSQVLVSFLLVVNGFGYFSSIGLFQSHWEEALGRPASDISWVGSLQLFLLFFVGTLSGRLMDAGYFRSLIAVGCALQLLGIFTTSAVTQYWQLLLSQGLVQGLGNGVLFTPLVTLVSIYFTKSRAFALGVAACGAPVGGVIFPTIARQLAARIEFSWIIRVMGFVVLFDTIVILLLARPKALHRPKAPWVDLRSWKEPTYALFAAGIFFVSLGIYFAYFYTTTFATDVIGVSSSTSLVLLQILNAAGVPGRLVTALLADLYFGPFNLLIPFSAGAGIMLLVWMVAGAFSGYLAFVILYGIFANAVQTLFPSALASLTTDMSKMGTRIGMVFTIVSLACLSGKPSCPGLTQHVANISLSLRSPRRFGALLPPSFSRDADPTVGYSQTVVPDDPSWSHVAESDFVVFDKTRGFEILGTTPKLERSYIKMLNVIHEAPIYVPHLNKLFTTQDGPPGNLTNIEIDLNVDPPTVKAFTTDPPVYQPTGGILHGNHIIWAVQGNNVSLPGGLKQRPGIVRVDPVTYKAEWLLNNYHGFFYGGLNDLTVGPDGDIWFTDSDYAYGLGLAPASNQNQLATYRFRPSTGEVAIVESSLQHPNGIVFSRDGKTLYVTDSGLETVGPEASDNGFYNYPIRIYFTSTNARNIFAYDVHSTPAGGSYLGNKRNIFQSLEGSPDGLKIAKNGYIVVGSGLSNGVDVIDPYGSVILRIQTDHPVENMAFGGPDLKTLFLVGIGGISRVTWDLEGPDPNNYYL